MEETISLQDIFKTLKKRWKLIFTLTLLAMAISAFISFVVLTPVYQSSTQILVNQEKQNAEQINAQDIQANLQLINTYSVIMKSPAILNGVIDRLNLNATAKQLTGQITVSSEQNSQVVNVTVSDTNPHRAVEIANTTAEVFQKEIKTMMNVNNVSILTPAAVDENLAPVKPNPQLNIAIGLVIGLMLGVGLAFLLEYLDTSIKTEQEVEELLGLPVLGFVSPISDSELGSSIGSIRSRRERN